MPDNPISLGLLAACLLLALAGCTANALPTPNMPVSLPGSTEAAAPATATRTEITPSPTAMEPGATPAVVAPATPPIAAEPTAAPAAAALSPPATAQPAQPAEPRVLAFTAAPATTQRVGDAITFTWQAQGDRATLCPFVLGLGGPAPLTPACVDVLPLGNRTVVVTEGDLEWDGMLLEVTSGAASARSTVSLTLGCQGLYDWFFASAPARCPQGAAITAPAAAQRFEHGLMIWLQEPDRFYVFFDETPQVFQWIESPYGFNPGASPDNRVGEPPPPGLFEPVSGFGQLWRGEFADMASPRPRLGWAREPEFGYTAHYQCARSMGRLWTCFLAAPDGRVLALRPDSSAQVRFLWDAQ